MALHAAQPGHATHTSPRKHRVEAAPERRQTATRINASRPEASPDPARAEACSLIRQAALLLLDLALDGTNTSRRAHHRRPSRGRHQARRDVPPVRRALSRDAQAEGATERIPIAGSHCTGSAGTGASSYDSSDLTRLPVSTALPVSSQRRDIVFVLFVTVWPPVRPHAPRFLFSANPHLRARSGRTPKVLEKSVGYKRGSCGRVKDKESVNLHRAAYGLVMRIPAIAIRDADPACDPRRQQQGTAQCGQLSPSPSPAPPVEGPVPPRQSRHPFWRIAAGHDYEPRPGRCPRRHDGGGLQHHHRGVLRRHRRCEEAASTGAHTASTAATADGPSQGSSWRGAARAGERPQFRPAVTPRPFASITLSSQGQRVSLVANGGWRNRRVAAVEITPPLERAANAVPLVSAANRGRAVSIRSAPS